MLKHIYTIVLSAALIMLVSCSKDSNDEPGLTPDEEPVEVVVTVLEGAFAPNETGPRMVIEADGWSIIEYRTNGEEHEEMTHLHFLNPDYKASIVISGFDKGAIIYEYDIMTRKPSSEVYLTHESGNNLIVSLCNMDWQTLKYDIISESVVEMKNNRALTRGAYEDDIRNIFIRLLDNISQNISEFCETTSWFSKSNAISLIGSIWTKVAIPCAKYQLLNEVPENTPEIEDELIEISNDLPINYSTHILFSLIPCNFNRLLIHTYDIFIDYYTRIASYQQPTEEEVYESFDIITRISNKSYPLIEAADGYIPAYKVDLSVTDVTETSAVLNGSSTALGSTYPYISSMGYEVDGTDGYHKNILSDMMNSITIDGLTPGTEYRVTAYLNSMGHRYERSVRFYTDISLKLYPNSLLFSAEGGSKGVALSIPRDNLKS